MGRPGAGKPLKGVRPTTSKTLESLLAILAPDLPDARVVDLFAGTGQVGIGFLQAGAASVTFVEAAPKVARALQVRLAGVEGEWALHKGQLPQALSSLRGRFDIFWADPPYDWEDWAVLLPASAPLASPGALLVVEHHHKTPYAEVAGWELYREKKFGETRLSFFRFRADSEEAEERGTTTC